MGDAGGRQPSEYWQWYSGIGNLVGTDWQNEADRGRMQEAYGTDALGNVVWRRSDDGGGGSAHIRWDQEYDAGLGRLRTIGSVNTGYASADFYPENTTRSYDAAGNVRRAVLSQMGDVNGNVDEVRDKVSLSFYGADQRLRYFQERDLRRVQESSWAVQLEGVWEEYRYDPLGRRVMVNTRTAGLCNSGGFRCASATTHMVWAGDQLLWELRRASESAGEESSNAGSYGTVSYTHAGGIDRPLVITKDGTSILPHQNWRGQFSSGTRPADGSRSDCQAGVVANCVQIAWPGHRTTAWHHAAKEPDIRTWWGGLVDGMRDASGQMYMRNRYTDPATGQFTQSDPIGIAGGLNSYGFAAGDPVTYNDPYGLDAIKIVFPDYRISTPLGRRALGHAAVISVDGNGVTRYYEYGRYPNANGRPSNRGFVRRREVPNVEMGRNGRPTQASLENLYTYVSQHYGQGGRVDADYHADADASAVNEFAENRMNDPKRDDYGLILNNCYDFADDAVRAGRRATREQQRAKQKEDEKD